MARVTIAIPTPLRPFVDGRSEVEVEGRTVAEALQSLFDQNERLRAQLYGDDGSLRNFVNVYLDREDIRNLEGEASELREGSRLSIVPSIAGGTSKSVRPAPPAGRGARPAAAPPSPDASGAAPPGATEPAAGAGGNSGFTPDELRRYSRHLTMPEVGLEGQRRLKNASVLLVGVGGLGSPAALYLAAAGVGRLGLVDFDVVEFTNLQRQVLHDTQSVGRPKLESARRRIQGLNPEIQVEVHEARLTSANALDVLRGYDLVVDGSDNFPTRYLVNDACLMLGIPTVYGAIFRFEGQASVFGVPGGPCYRCLFPEPPPADLVPNCVEAGVLGVLPGIVGTIQAAEAVKLILGRGQSLAGRLLLVDALAMEFRELEIRRDPECPVCGESPTVTELIDYEQFCGMGASAEADREIPEIEVAQLKVLLEDGAPVQILDVREPYEWEICNLGPQGARLIPEGELAERLRELDADGRLVVHCRSGGRSRKAVEFLREFGFTNAVNLKGGILAWAREIDPEMKAY
ncbi:MAG: molybdopterin-synthase adenylyltransferase MoeB [Gemmatimonadota bacterium]